MTSITVETARLCCPRCHDRAQTIQSSNTNGTREGKPGLMFIQVSLNLIFKGEVF